MIGETKIKARPRGDESTAVILQHVRTSRVMSEEDEEEAVTLIKK